MTTSQLSENTEFLNKCSTDRNLTMETYQKAVLSPNGNMETPPVDSEPHLLISSVRKSYLSFLSQLVSENYVEWSGRRPPLDVAQCARSLELRAATHAMVVPLYRQAVLSTIKSIKKYTKIKDLHPDVEEFCIKYRSHSKGTQTDSEKSENISDIKHKKNENALKSKNEITNDKEIIHGVKNASIKIDKGQEEVIKSDPQGVKPEDDNTFSLEQNCFDSIINSNKDLTSSDNKISMPSDDIMLEMEKLFKVDDVEKEDDIFDRFMGNQQVKMIMDEINKYGNDTNIDFSPEPEDVISQNEDGISQNEDDWKTNGAQANNLSLDKRLDMMIKPVGCSIVSSSQPVNTEKYVYSKWPCELYFQRKMLQEKLDSICDRSFKTHAKIKERFVDLFGCDSDDEQALQSPDTSMDFARSCRQRAAPFLSKHLQSFAKKMGLASHLFRPLAKHLLYRLIHFNQYPNDYECYLFVKEYFKYRPRIRCQADF